MFNILYSNIPGRSLPPKGPLNQGCLGSKEIVEDKDPVVFLGLLESCNPHFRMLSWGASFQHCEA